MKRAKAKVRGAFLFQGNVLRYHIHDIILLPDLFNHIFLVSHIASFLCRSLQEGITPLQEWNRDSRPLRFLDVSVVTEAFLHHEERLVDKGACISFRGRRYETKPSLIGSRVEISYDPSSPETITVKHPGIEPFTAKPLEMKEFCDQTPALPVSMQEKEPECSRMLEVLEKKRRISRKHMADAVSFGQYRKDGGNHV